MTSKELSKLKKALPRGYRDKLAVKFMVSTVTIDRVLRGAHDRPDIIDGAITLAEEHKEYLASLATKIKSL
jgi:hypothetical protein